MLQKGPCSFFYHNDVLFHVLKIVSVVAEKWLFKMAAYAVAANSILATCTMNILKVDQPDVNSNQHFWSQSGENVYPC